MALDWKLEVNFAAEASSGMIVWMLPLRLERLLEVAEERKLLLRLDRLPPQAGVK